MLVCRVASFDPLLKFGPNTVKNGILEIDPKTNSDHAVGQTTSEERKPAAKLFNFCG